MTDKPDLYAVLGLAKEATLEDIKAAHKKAVLKNHPDRQHGKTDAEKAAAAEKFRQVTEAFEVLKDDRKRQTYDRYGHEGLKNLADGKASANGPSFADLAGKGPQRGPLTEEDAFSFFDRARETTGPVSTTPAASDTPPALSDEEAREARRRSREARRGTGVPSFADSLAPPPPVTPVSRPAPAPAPKPAPAPQPVAKTPAVDFCAVTQLRDKAQEKLNTLKTSSVDVPLETLESFRQNLQDMVNVVDELIARAPKPGFKR